MSTTDKKNEELRIKKPQDFIAPCGQRETPCSQNITTVLHNKILNDVCARFLEESGIKDMLWREKEDTQEWLRWP